MVSTGKCGRCRHEPVQPEEMPPAPFDTEIGLTYTELSTDGVKAHLTVQPHLHHVLLLLVTRYRVKKYSLVFETPYN